MNQRRGDPLQGATLPIRSSLTRFLRVQHWGIQLPIFWTVAAVYYLTVDTAAADYGIAVAAVSLIQVLLLAGAYTLNDFFDWDADRSKAAVRQSTAAGLKLASAAFLLLAGVILATSLLRNPRSAGLAWLQTFVGVAYSMPIVRLKERGLLGVLVAAAFQRIPPFLMLYLAMPRNSAAALVLTGWLFVVGLLFIVEHQLEDFKADQSAGVSTFARSIGASRAYALRNSLHRLLPVSVVIAGSVILILTPGLRALLAIVLLFSGHATLHFVIRWYYADNDKWASAASSRVAPRSSIT